MSRCFGSCFFFKFKLKPSNTVARCCPTVFATAFGMSSSLTCFRSLFLRCLGLDAREYSGVSQDLFGFQVQILTALLLFVSVDLYLFLERPLSYSLTCSVELKHAESKLNHVCRSERIPERRPEMKDVSLPAPQVCHPHSVTTLLQPHSLLARRHDVCRRGRGCCKRQTTVETHLQSRKEDTQKQPELCKPAKQNM